jgi:hypothetical protein
MHYTLAAPALYKIVLCRFWFCIRSSCELRNTYINSTGSCAVTKIHLPYSIIRYISFCTSVSSAIPMAMAMAIPQRRRGRWSLVVGGEGGAGGLGPVKGALQKMEGPWC